MINNDYIVDMSWHDSGGYCDFLPIKDHPDLGFKAFKKKNKAEQALLNQRLLASFDLAPEPITELCKIPYGYDKKVLELWTPKETTTNWGFVTEKAHLLDLDKTVPFKQIQSLVDNIWIKTRIKFWDCHEMNVGYIKRGRKKKLVCIDTGKESFDSYSNAWGFAEPGPKCCYCDHYQCKCIGD